LLLRWSSRGVRRGVRAVAALLLSFGVLASLPGEVIPVRAGDIVRRRQIPESTWRPRVEWRKSGSDGELVVNGISVVRYRQSRGGMSPVMRAQSASVTLQLAVENDLKPSQVTVDSSDPDAPTVKAAGEIIATAMAEKVTAKRKRTRERLQRAAREDAKDQAQRWAANVRRALNAMPLTVEGIGQIVPVGEKRTLRIRGIARGPISVYNADGVKKAGAAVDAVKGVITLTGIEPGRETLYIEREGAVKPVSVIVQPYAGQVEVPATVIVTGTVTPAEIISRFAILSASAAARPLPGARLEVRTDKVVTQPLKYGQAQTIVVPIQMTGVDMLPVIRKVHVSVVNRPVTKTPANTLLYSNNPEKVKEPATLFVGRVNSTMGAVTRLLYHHQSDTAKNLMFTAELVNDGDQPARVQLIGGDAGPERDTVWVGYRAASDFVSAHENVVGVILEVPAKSRVPLSSVRLPAGLTISGLMELRLVSGPAPLVRVKTDNWDGTALATYVPLPMNEAAIAAAHSDHIYANPTKKVAGEYTVGGAWTFMKFGRVPLSAVSGSETVLHGNYGVFYEIDVKMQNPTDKASTARVVFEPSAGMAGGVFLIGDKRVEIPRTDMPTETTLATYTLAPGETRDVRIRTMPVSGSNYPATIIVRP
jgi:hypothetical protein